MSASLSGTKSKSQEKQNEDKEKFDKIVNVSVSKQSSHNEYSNSQ